jgi:hypothetical protein
MAYAKCMGFFVSSTICTFSYLHIRTLILFAHLHIKFAHLHINNG